MGASYYLAADQDQGATWDFTTAQLTTAVAQLWPEATAEGPFPPNGVLELHVHIQGVHTQVTYFPEQQFLTFEDQDPLEAPVEVAYRLLNALAPATPAAWANDDDGEAHPVDLTAGLDALVADIVG